MERNRFEGICGNVSEGKVKWVDNLATHQPGRVVACTAGNFEVETEGHQENWDPEICKERTYGYRPVYGRE